MTNTTKPVDKNALSKRMYALGWTITRVDTNVLVCNSFGSYFTFDTLTKTWNNQPEDLVALEEAFKRFDWSYDYSDDFSVWKRGEAAKKALAIKCRGLIGPDKIRILNRKYNGKRPSNTDIPTD